MYVDIVFLQVNVQIDTEIGRVLRISMKVLKSYSLYFYFFLY